MVMDKMLLDPSRAISEFEMEGSLINTADGGKRDPSSRGTLRLSFL